MPELLHATFRSKVPSIKRHGLRVSGKTKRATAYCKPGEFDCERAEAFTCSEDVLEKVRRQVAPSAPSRLKAVFFSPKEGDFRIDEPEESRFGEEDPMTGEKDYDFGFGKNALLVVDSNKIPCKCGVGDNAKSDNVFKVCIDEAKGEQTFSYLKSREEEAKGFWRTAQIYNPRTYDPFREKNGETIHELPEIWCPCAVPASAILTVYDKNNPVPTR